MVAAGSSVTGIPSDVRMATGLRRPAARVNALKSTRRADNSGSSGPLCGPCPARGRALQPPKGVATRSGTRPGPPERQSAESDRSRLRPAPGDPSGSPKAGGKGWASDPAVSVPSLPGGAGATVKILSLFRATTPSTNSQTAPDNAFSGRIGRSLSLLCAREQYPKDPRHPGPPPGAPLDWTPLRDRVYLREVVVSVDAAGRDPAHLRRRRPWSRPLADEFRDHHRDPAVHHSRRTNDYRARPKLLRVNARRLERQAPALPPPVLPSHCGD